MGIGAYYRGNRVISAQVCADIGCRGCLRCSDPPAPTPRPEGWGDKTYAKALARAVGLAAYWRSRGTEFDVADLADAIREDVKCGRETARRAATEAVSEVEMKRREERIEAALRQLMKYDLSACVRQVCRRQALAALADVPLEKIVAEEIWLGHRISPGHEFEAPEPTPESGYARKS